MIGVCLWPPSSPDLNPFDYTICDVLENKTNATSHPNIGLLKNAIEEEWNKMSEEFVLKTYKSFDTIIEKMVAILSKFIILCLSSSFIVHFFFKLRLILFYKNHLLLLLY